MEQEEIVSDTKLQYISSGFAALLRGKYCIVEDCQYAVWRWWRNCTPQYMFGRDFTEPNLEEPWKPLLLICSLLSEVIQKGRMKASTLCTLDHAIFFTWLSAAELLGVGTRTTHSYPVLNECPDLKVTVLASSSFAQLFIPWLLLPYDDSALAGGVNSNFNLLLFLPSGEVWNLSAGREPKMHFPLSRWVT